VCERKCVYEREVGVCCSVLQCVAVCCSVVQSVELADSIRMQIDHLCVGERECVRENVCGRERGRSEL